MNSPTALGSVFRSAWMLTRMSPCPPSNLDFEVAEVFVGQGMVEAPHRFPDDGEVAPEVRDTITVDEVGPPRDEELADLGKGRLSRRVPGGCSQREHRI